jgi:hypothetical protein
MTPKTAIKYAWRLAPAAPYAFVGALGAADVRVEPQPYRDEAGPAELATHEQEGERGEYGVQGASPVQSMATGATGAGPSATLPSDDLAPRAPINRLRPDNPDALPPLPSTWVPSNDLAPRAPINRLRPDNPDALPPLPSTWVP